MQEYTEVFDFIFSNIKNIISPEEWLAFDFEMSKQEFISLIIIGRKGEVIMSQIASDMNMPMSTATGIIDRLVKKGYIQRSRSETDRRIVTLVLSDKGKDFTNQMKERITGYIKVVYDVLAEEERQFLFKIVTKVISAVRKIDLNTGKDDVVEEKLKKINIE